MPETLSHIAGFEEVLWNFAHFEDERRISLQDNPHFYSELPTSLDAYTPEFKALPVDRFELKPNSNICVLVDQRRRVFLESRQETRIFSNIFTLGDAMIFKGAPNVLSIPHGAFNVSLDIHGALEGESVVAESMRGILNLWPCEAFVVSDSSTSVPDFSLRPIVTSNPTAKHTFKQQKKLIRGALSSVDNDLHIYVGQSFPLWTPQIRYRRKVRR